MRKSARHMRNSRWMLAWLTASLIAGCSQTSSAPSDGEVLGPLAVGAVIPGAGDSPDGGQEVLLEETEILRDKDSPFGQVASISGLSARIEQSSPGSNHVVVEGSGDAEFSLERTAPSEFVLKLPEVRVEEDSMPEVAGLSEGAIRSVRILGEGEGSVVRIFAQPDFDLNAEMKDGKIVVAATPMTDFGEARAQMKPEGEVGEAKTEEVPPAKPSEVKISASDIERSMTPGSLVQAETKYSGRLISLDLQDTDIDNALRVIAEVSNLNIIASEDVQGKVTLRLYDVPWDQALDVILKTNGLDKVQEGNVIRIAPVEKLRAERESLKQAQQAEEELEPLQVRFVRVSYAKAADLKPLIDSVLTERGSSTYDDRTNQLIIKDIAKGIKNVAMLVSKVDLRTPQVLLETQIVEATRSIIRELGAEFNFQYIQSPMTGNATGRNFPNAIDFNGGLNNIPGTLSSNPISALFTSADGSKSLGVRLASLEQEGRARVVSRPAVATTNNKQAIIKSVEKVRIRLPNGGVAVATGQGANAAGQGQIATETIEIGITLEVTAQASPDYYVLLDINAKSSTFSDKQTDGIPNEFERSATSSVLVSSGQTFALGGIYKISDVDNLSGLPFFKNIPFLGHLFRYSKIDSRDEELLFFLTPRIVEGSFDDSIMKTTNLF